MGVKSAFLPILLAILLVVSGVSNSFDENGAVQQDKNNVIQTVISVVVFIFVIFVVVDIVTDIFSPNGEV